MSEKQNKFMVVALMSGCVSQQPDMVRAGDVSLEKISPNGVHVMWAQVRQEGEYVVITGSVTPRGVGTRRYSGYVDVELTDSSGEVVGRGRSERIDVPLRGPGKGTRLKRFEVRVKAVVPANGNVRVAYQMG